jgi:uncharacterized protein (DUF2342 family)
MAGSFLAQIQRAKAASQATRPATKPVEELTSTELDEALRLARIEAVEANRAVAAVAAEQTRPPTLAGKLAELQRGKRNHWR